MPSSAGVPRGCGPTSCTLPGRTLYTYSRSTTLPLPGHLCLATGRGGSSVSLCREGLLQQEDHLALLPLRLGGTLNSGRHYSRGQIL